MRNSCTETILICLALCFTLSACRNPEDRSRTYVIGDLHGDAECARFWINATGIISNLDQDESQWRWIDSTSRLVFMGDYVDKGPQSLQTVSLVKTLTERYPAHVTALMGNHELELLLDRNGKRDEWGGHRFMDLSYASVHPLEYRNYINSTDEVDDKVFRALLDASMSVYSEGNYNRVVFIPDDNILPDQKKSILDYVRPHSLRGAVGQKLKEYQQAYIDAFASTTELGHWIENLPIAHISDSGTLFVHGGVRQHQFVLEKLVEGKKALTSLNAEAARNLRQERMTPFLETLSGEVVYDLLTYRGNHPPRANCGQLSALLDSLPGVKRLVVGHTPEDGVRILCDGQFVAADSSLSRWFRANGNDYCDGLSDHHAAGQVVCNRMSQSCDGQIIVIDHKMDKVYSIHGGDSKEAGHWEL